MNIHFTHTVYSIVGNTNTFLQGTNCMEKFCADLNKSMQQKLSTMRKRKSFHWQMGKLNHTVIKNPATFAKRNFMDVMIVMIAMKTVMIAMMIKMVIVMIKIIMVERPMKLLRDLMILMITIAMMIVIRKNWATESAMVMLKD